MFGIEHRAWAGRGEWERRKKGDGRLGGRRVLFHLVLRGLHKPESLCIEENRGRRRLCWQPGGEGRPGGRVGAKWARGRSVMHGDGFGLGEIQCRSASVAACAAE